jgi:rhamnogalacturonyl hydrolase YesR
MYAYLQNAPRDADGIIVYNASKSSSIFADGIGQTSMFLSLYGRCFGEDRALDLAKKQLLGFMKNGMDEKSHLPYHGYARREDGSIEKKGVLSWGRAAGWLIMGLSEYVSCMRMGRASGADADSKEADDTLLLDWYKELTTALLTYTRPDGGYSWQVQAIDGHLDTSATGMILYGILNGCGCAQKDMTRGRELFDRETSDGKVGNALSSCDDFGVHYQTYGNYPWGQGAGLAFVSLFMERI